MKKMISLFLSRALCALSALAGLVGSSGALGQPGVPPTEMSISQFNEGRPANFYYLADATEGYEAVCEEVLEALNEPYPAEPYAEYNERYSKYLLRSRLSVPWVEMPDFGGGARNSWDLRNTRFDLNNDGAEEDILLIISNLSSQPVHSIVVASLGLLPLEFQELSEENLKALIESGAVATGQLIEAQIPKSLVARYKEYDPYLPSSYYAGSPYFDVASIGMKHYLLFTNSGPLSPRRNVIVFDVNRDFSILPSCRLESRFSVIR